MGREAVILTANEANPMDYSNMRCDAVIFTGCPRVPIDDAEKFSMPILTVTEFQMVLSPMCLNTSTGFLRTSV